MAAQGNWSCRIMRHGGSVYGAVGILAEIHEHAVDGRRGGAAGACRRVRARRSGCEIKARQRGASTHAGPDADDPDLCLSRAAGGAVRLRPGSRGSCQHDLCGTANDPQCAAGAAIGAAGTSRGVFHVRNDTMAALLLYRASLRQAADPCRHQPAGSGQPVDGHHRCRDRRVRRYRARGPRRDQQGVRTLRTGACRRHRHRAAGRRHRQADSRRGDAREIYRTRHRQAGDPHPVATWLVWPWFWPPASR